MPKSCLAAEVLGHAHLVGEVRELGPSQQLLDQAPHVLHCQASDCGIGVAGCRSQMSSQSRPQLGPNQADPAQVEVGRLDEASQGVGSWGIPRLGGR